MSHIPTTLAWVAGLVTFLAVVQAMGPTAVAPIAGIVVAVGVFAGALRSDAVPSEHAGM